MKDVYERALEAHRNWKGKISVESKAEVNSNEELALAYTPGVAEPCRQISKDESLAYEYTWKGNTIAVISDGTAVLGLGDIGPEAALPVMEGKSILFKKFGGVNAVPIVLDTKDTEEIIQTIKNIAPTYGGINLEDIAAPRCVEIERRLIEDLDIPVFHDDQHGTAIVVTAALINAFKLAGKDPKDVSVVVSGTGAAGFSIINMVKKLGVNEIYAFNRKGILRRSEVGFYNFVETEIAEITNIKDEDLTMSQAMERSDVFIGVSGPNVINKEMVRSMKSKPIVFAMANPEPEIPYEEAIAGGAFVAGTGRSDFPNQVNNVLAFPGLFKGALKARANKITEEMKMAAAVGIANLIPEEELTPKYVIPSVFDERVADSVAEEVMKVAMNEDND